MATINRSALMPYSASQMYAVVNDVAKYPEFLPWCANSEILSHNESSMEASILMKKGKLNHSFTTRNSLIPNQRIHMELVNGPFKSLSGDWIFTELSDSASKIELQLEFEFSNRVIGLLIGPVFTQIANSLVDAFCQRAHQLYKS
jgi:ribosome-associated toxin RatA of RatAB toxin-antitoxin module